MQVKLIVQLFLDQEAETSGTDRKGTERSEFTHRGMFTDWTEHLRSK